MLESRDLQRSRLENLTSRSCGKMTELRYHSELQWQLLELPSGLLPGGVMDNCLWHAPKLANCSDLVSCRATERHWTTNTNLMTACI